MEKFEYTMAIDFGTTFSGFAWKHRIGKEAYTQNPWKGSQSMKTATAILYNRQGQPESFGSEAVELARKDGKCYLLELFKIDLLSFAQNGGEPFKMIQVSGQDVKVDLRHSLQVFLKFIVDKGLEHMRTYSPREVDENTIRWVITAPGNAHNPYIYWLHEAAHAIGIRDQPADQPDTNNFFTAREPEVAAFYSCESETLVNFLEKPGSRFMVLDCGGGTVDFGSYTVKRKNPYQFEPKRSPTAQTCGGSFLNKNFCEVLLPVVLASQEDRALEMIDFENDPEIIKAKTFIAKISSEEGTRASWLQVMKTFEEEKKRWLNDRNWIEIEFKLSLAKHIKENYPEYYNLMVRKEMYDPQGNIESWTVPYELVEKFIFKPVVAQTMAALEDEMAQLRNLKFQLDYLVLVGGFCESLYLRNAIRAKYDSEVEVITPPFPQKAVVVGAAGYDPDTLLFRILQHAFAVRVNKPFGDGSKDEYFNKWIWHPDLGKMCTERLEIVLEKGSVIQTGSDHLFKLKAFRPIDPNIEFIDFEIYYSPNNESEYIDSVGVRIETRVRINHTDSINSYILSCYYKNTSEVVFVIHDDVGNLLHTTAAMVGATYSNTVGSEKSKAEQHISDPLGKVCYLLFDISGSMGGQKLAEAKSAAHEFINYAKSDSMQIGLISFESKGRLEQSATSDFEALHNRINHLSTTGTTNMMDALQIAFDEFKKFPDVHYKKSICIFSDGEPDSKDTTRTMAHRCVTESKADIVYIPIQGADTKFLDSVAVKIISSNHGLIVDLIHAAKYIKNN